METKAVESIPTNDSSRSSALHPRALFFPSLSVSTCVCIVAVLLSFFFSLDRRKPFRFIKKKLYNVKRTQTFLSLCSGGSWCEKCAPGTLQKERERETDLKPWTKKKEDSMSTVLHGPLFFSFFHNPITFRVLFFFSFPSDHRLTSRSLGNTSTTEVIIADGTRTHRGVERTTVRGVAPKDGVVTTPSGFPIRDVFSVGNVSGTLSC